MSQQKTYKRILLRIGIILSLPVLLLGGCLVFDGITMSAARPPASLKTIDDFKAWKGDSIIGQGQFEAEGVTYTVMLAPAGRSWASGPSAYLFDEKGQFVDWTGDMGDYYTEKNQFNLTSGHVKNVIKKQP
jgi:hypothetical protein